MLTLSALLQTSRALLRAHCGPGDAVLDATMGNGRDTVFLAQLVGPEGLVIAMDKQADAVERTAELLDDMELAARARLLQCTHADLGNILPLTMQVAKRASLAAAVFNLGYLPGGDKKVVTDASSTVRALGVVWPLIRPGGLLCVHTYTGHEGAAEEADAVAAWMREIPWAEGQATACVQHNKPANPETLYLLIKATA